MKIYLGKVALTAGIMLIAVGVCVCCLQNVDFSKYKDITVCDFMTGVNNLTEIAFNLEVDTYGKDSKTITPFGTEEKVITALDVNPALMKALVRIADMDKDGNISESELSSLNLRKINNGIYNEEINKNKIIITLLDRNFSHYLIITSGPYEGTILYNGNLEIIDRDNNRYFGLGINIKS